MDTGGWLILFFVHAAHIASEAAATEYHRTMMRKLSWVAYPLRFSKGGRFFSPIPKNRKRIIGRTDLHLSPPAVISEARCSPLGCAAMNYITGMKERPTLSDNERVGHPRRLKAQRAPPPTLHQARC